ncbi:MAG TPA: hypothetical protein VKH81_08270 [Candidatus Angelobacter sp.]|nr:hypothetical protein [Candidatus Angelobacter sp.]
MQKVSLITKIFIAAVVVTGIAMLVNGLFHWTYSKPVELLGLLLMAVVASRLKVKLPGINGTMSVNVPYLLIIAVRLGAGEALAIAALAGLVQSISALKKRETFVQALFSSAAITNSIAAAILAFRFASSHGWLGPLSVSAAGAAFFLVNTIQIALVLWLAEGKNLVEAWRGMAQLSVPYYVLSAEIAAVVCMAVQFATWGEGLALLPIMYSIHASYKLYFTTPAMADRLPGEANPMAQPATSTSSASVAIH